MVPTPYIPFGWGETSVSAKTCPNNNTTGKINLKNFIIYIFQSHQLEKEEEKPS